MSYKQINGSFISCSFDESRQEEPYLSTYTGAFLFSCNAPINRHKFFSMKLWTFIHYRFPDLFEIPEICGPYNKVSVVGDEAWAQSYLRFISSYQSATEIAHTYTLRLQIYDASTVMKDGSAKWHKRFRHSISEAASLQDWSHFCL